MDLPNSSYAQEIIDDYVREAVKYRPDSTLARLTTICIDFASAGLWSHVEAWKVIRFAASREMAADPQALAQQLEPAAELR